MWAINPIPGPFGAEITGVDLAAEKGPGVVKRLAELLYTHRVLAIHDQQLTPEAYVQFGRQWGRPTLLIAKDNRRADYPEMITITNSTTVPEYSRDYAVHWHNDSSYEEVEASVTMLCAEEAPDHGGETLLADGAAAYSALPPDVQERIRPMMVLHAVGRGKPMQNEVIHDPRELPEEKRKKIILEAPVRHPLVARHPVTGTLSLYGLGGSAFGIEGLSEGEAQRLLSELKQHAISKPFRQTYKIRKGDVFLWDNYLVMHSASPLEYSDEPGKRRILYRISVKGLPDFMRGKVSTHKT